ncbi:HAD family hydrolase [Desulfosarcina ovata]|uniref:phosphoglycolate phosphatase n=2 Tax=Desulfosarcina ovata TaxID=83564 RepID=A0A5K8AHW3_9BACT|nr:HAD-IA family hydrolase [Desulfosarcina ovata]BBO85379.1 haloacid dehalogenase [Desulfosarcina ovata subsp. sediminis]BBO92282.1 haloacid dehalogenase [Desulfosarcina ovata subsp. ovata]
MKQHPKVVAFDCDGVMFDSRKANQAYYNHVLSHVGLPEMTPDQANYSHMQTVDAALAYMIPDEAARQAAHAFRKQMGYLPFLRLMEMEPGLVPLLEKLRPRYKTAVATNRTDTMARVLADNHIEHLFDLVVCAMDVRFPKPHPESLNKVVDHFGVRPEEVLYIGDSEVDETAAIAAGIAFVAYRNPDLKADHHIDRLAEIEAMLGLG